MSKDTVVFEGISEQQMTNREILETIYNALQAARLTKITPFKPLTLSVGLLQAGAVSNVIPNDLTFAGTARLFDREEVGYPFKETLIKIVDGICAAYAALLLTTSSSDPAYPVYQRSGVRRVRPQGCRR